MKQKKDRKFSHLCLSLSNILCYVDSLGKFLDMYPAVTHFPIFFYKFTQKLECQSIHLYIHDISSTSQKIFIWDVFPTNLVLA